MLNFDEVIEDVLIVGRNKNGELRTHINKNSVEKIEFISIRSTSDELRQIADKLDELNKS